MKNKEHDGNGGGIAAREKKGPLWYFLPGKNGSFLAPYADYISRLYFPMMNTYGMKCSVTPDLKGDICSSFQNYLTAATVTEELHRNVSGRNFWVHVPGYDPWSAAGNSAFQKKDKWSDEADESEVEGQIGAFVSRRKNSKLGLESEVTVFVPESGDFVELMQVRIKNTSDKEISFIPTSATPIFGRHADNFRDHRQVTTMFQEVFVEEHGVRIKPRIVHDEKGHSVNSTSYAVLGFEEDGGKPEGIWAAMTDFIGEGGSLDNPEAVYKDLPAPVYEHGRADGREAIGAMRYTKKTLKPGETAVYIILHGITDDENDLRQWKEKYGSSAGFDSFLQETLKFWQTTANSVSFDTGKPDFDNWAKWISFQLKCRQIFGNSYLPDFGYGRGGRGWRDLWQDLISIFLIDPAGAREEILNNFMGIRVDGSNATIIGTRPGEFKADRNNIPRTWCDHGAWPVFVVDFYIQQTGDTDILLQEMPYWKDIFSHRSKKKDPVWEESQGFRQLDESGNNYEGSILEHMLLQQLTAFFNVGDHNNLLLEGGDWNDTLDMARDKGESVCFHNFYGGNLSTIASLLEKFQKNGLKTVSLLAEIVLLLDRLPGGQKVDYNIPAQKQERLSEYFQKVIHTVSGNKEEVDIADLVRDLREKSDHVADHIRKNEWLETEEGTGFFNGHYDNNGRAVHGNTEKGVRMDLTSQVMPVMFNMASKQQVKELYSSARKYLGDKEAPGLRLCTEFDEIDLDIGRITGFTYGHKEHGSKWSQQNIMFMYGLYKRGFAQEGLELFEDIYNLSTNSSRSLVFPGITSYFEPGDRGAYAYLTGSSAWLLLTLTTQIFGVDGLYGDLLLHPKLNSSFFDQSGLASISRGFRDLKLTVEFENSQKTSFPGHYIEKITVNGTLYDTVKDRQQSAVIPYSFLKENSRDKECIVKVTLAPA